jgi:hypothetical protein
MSTVANTLSFNEEIILRILDLSIVVVGAVVAALLAYFLGIKNLVKSQNLSREESRLSRQENELYRKIDLYKDLIKDLMDTVSLNPSDKERKKEMAEKLNRHGMELIQFAPDHVYREYIRVLSNWKKGRPINDLLTFMITLRKELIPNTTLTSSDFGTIEFL